MPSPCGGVATASPFLNVALPSLFSVYGICRDVGCLELDARVLRCCDSSVPVGFGNGSVDWSVLAGFWIGERFSVRICLFSLPVRGFWSVPPRLSLTKQGSISSWIFH